MIKEKEESKFIKHTECLSCGSSDAKAIYDDGHTFCFSCEAYTPPREGGHSFMEEVITPPSNDSAVPVYTREFVAIRGINKGTMKAYKVLSDIDEEGVPVRYRFQFGKLDLVKQLNNGAIHTEGDTKGVALFGKELFNSAEAKALTITEGAEDAMSVYQMLGSKYPCVSVRSATTARRDAEKDYAYINSFEKIYLCFDNDKPGQKALKEVASLFDVNKVYHVKLDKYKDANDYLVNGASEAFTRVWWNAKRYLPKGIIGSYDDVFDLLNKKDEECIGTYPFPTLQGMTYGIRPGETNLFTALPKVGKTEVMRAMEYHLLKTTDHNVGIVHLEEGEKRSVQGLVGYHMGAPVHLPDSGVPLDDQLSAYKDLTRRDGRVYYYSHFGSDDPDVILGAIRYLGGVCGCKFIFLDHISIIVSGLDGEDERKKLDYIATRLATMARELGFALFLVSHVNDNGDTRGSRAIAQLADLIVHMTRNKEHPDETERSLVHLMVKGNRFAGFSGPGGMLRFDLETHRLEEQDSSVQETANPFPTAKDGTGTVG